MKHHVIFALNVILTLTTASGICSAQSVTPSSTVKITADSPGIKLNPGFYGLMTEEINHAFDGGLYAELIQNRNFRMNNQKPVHWSLVQDGGASGSMALSTASPLNVASPNTLELAIAQAGHGQRVGAANDGYWGIPVLPNTTYSVSFFAEGANGFAGSVGASLESADGGTVFASASVPQITGEWHQYRLTLKTGTVTPSSTNRFVIFATSPGTLRLSQVSLFPPTYKGRANGNRIDLMEKLAALKPAFLRMPGGNYVDPGHLIWKNTIGPIQDRPGSPGAWGYRIDEGLGLLEMLEWCQDLHMAPILAVSDGRDWLPGNADEGPLVQDALDEIEYATGSVHTPWGAKRAEDGHPIPFHIEYVEIGNEDFFGNKDVYNVRFAKFYDAIHAKYPELKIISTSGEMTSRVPDVVDEHYYRNIKDMEANVYQFDTYPRTGPKIFVGEWETMEGAPTAYLASAVSDGAWLTGLERNADVVIMECYAPLFVNVNPRASQWLTNLIGYNALSSFGSPSYYVQEMFANNHGDIELPTITKSSTSVTPRYVPSGGVGVGTWQTQAEYKDVSVTNNGSTLAPTDPSNAFSGWAGGSSWSTAGNVVTQTGSGAPATFTDVHPDWNDYTYHLSAEKTGGREGFLILFHVKDSNNYLWWNIGGWGNSRTQIEDVVDGDKQPLGTSFGMKVETGRWYDIKVVVAGSNIKCYLDGNLVNEANDTGPALTQSIFASSSRDSSSGKLFVHLVNAGPTPQTVAVKLTGRKSYAPKASGLVITGAPHDQNSIADPLKVAPKPVSIKTGGSGFTYDAPANSVTVLTLTPKQ